MKKTLALLLPLLISSHISAKPPKAPEGYKWVKQEECSDEFNGKKLDTKKWRKFHPFWATGRAPGRFTPDTISVENGKMRIRNRMMDKPDEKWKIACGAVTSKSENLYFGYYEVRMKASYTGLSSTFWFTNRSKNGVHHELDVIETLGNSRKYPQKNKQMPANTHTFYNKNGKKVDAKKGGKCSVSPQTHKTFHTYACWWIDENTIKFYVNDKYRFTLNPSTVVSDKPFNRPMFMCLVTETYNWEPTPPASDFDDPVKASTYYDWVRGWKLVKMSKEDKLAAKRKDQKDKAKNKKYGKEAMERLKRRMRFR